MSPTELRGSLSCITTSRLCSVTSSRQLLSPGKAGLVLIFTTEPIQSLLHHGGSDPRLSIQLTFTLGANGRQYNIRWYERFTHLSAAETSLPLALSLVFSSRNPKLVALISRLHPPAATQTHAFFMRCCCCCNTPVCDQPAGAVFSPNAVSHVASTCE